MSHWSDLSTSHQSDDARDVLGLPDAKAAAVGFPPCLTPMISGLKCREVRGHDGRHKDRYGLSDPDDKYL